MKNQFVLSILLLIFVSPFLFAQGPGEREPQTPQERATKVTDKLTEALALDEDQKDAIFAINYEAAQRNDSLRNAGRELMRSFREARQAGEEINIEEMKAARESNNAKRKEIEMARDEKIMAFLNDEQKPKYEEMRQAAIQKQQKRMEERRGKRKGRRGSGGE